MIIILSHLTFSMDLQGIEHISCRCNMIFGWSNSLIWTELLIWYYATLRRIWSWVAWMKYAMW